MIKIGQMNRLKAIKQVDFGIFLNGDEHGKILLPRRYVPDGLELGDELDVFIYRDSNDEIIATTLTPKAMVGECAQLEVKEINDVGAFLDWGLPKDLLVPYNEQHKPMEVGRSYVVCIFLDPYTHRITASSRLSRHLEERADGFKSHQAVNLLICGRSEMGYKAVVNHTHLGLVFRDDAFRTLLYGERVQGYVKAIRDDRKIDLSLQPPASQARLEIAEQILQFLRDNGGVSRLTDKSDPDEIYRQYNVSKGNYKNALSKLYKERKIVIEKDRITLV
jgi:predicted RNA-binding protein (virulence factor B family)